jgi:hypothetical protein
MLGLWGYLSIIADWASILSIFVSGYAVYEITRVRSEMVGRVRLPVLVAALRKQGSSFATLLDGYKEDQTKRREFGLELARCQATLRLVLPKVSRDARQRTNKLIADIGTWRSAEIAEDDAWRIYAELNGLLEELKSVVEEQKIGA